MKKKILLLFLYCGFLLKAITLEEIDELRRLNIVTEEDYLILKEELTGNLVGTEYYTLAINGRVVENNYRVLSENKKKYLPLKLFLKAINLQNKEETEKILKVYLGNNLKEFSFSKENQEILEDRKKVLFENEGYKIKDDEIYLRVDIFESLFLTDFSIEESYGRIYMELNFMKPDEINQYLELQEKKLLNKLELENIIYSGERSIFDLGYTRVTAEKKFEKSAGNKRYNKSWNGNLEYQGGFLYGQIQGEYDADENVLSSVRLEYKDIWKGHTFNIENRDKNGKSREWGINFYKDDSYYTNGNKVIIRERVQLGSRAELKYMGTTIAIENENNGQVIFNNTLITSDRTYELIVYTPDGKITKKIITTINDYNQQNKGEIEYSLSLNEDHESKKYTKDVSIFYGYTNNLTFGLGYNQRIETIDSNYEYLNDGKASIIYGSSINGLSYVLSLNFEKSLDNYKNDRNDYSDKYKYDWTLQTTYGKFKYILKDSKFGEFYSQKEKQSFEIEYNPISNLRLGYEIVRNKNYNQSTENESIFRGSYTKGYKRFLFSAGTEINTENDETYNVAIYHTGLNNINTKLENKWSNSISNYETILSLYNNNYLGLLDYSFDIGYSQEYKDKFTFSFTLSYDNWLKIASSFDKDGSRTHTVGLDRIIDLKNPTKNISSIDVSRVKVITFIDENDNNILDADERTIDNVEVTIGQDSLITNKNGEGIFSNISNGILYDLKPTIKKPSFTLGTNKIQVKSNFSSTVEAYIPIKPMLNLSGFINIDKSLKLTELQKDELYNNLLIEIQDLNNNTLDITMPDNTGVFDISGLFPIEYIIKIEYIGTDFNLPGISEIIKMNYYENELENKIDFNFLSNEIIRGENKK
ncbi:hypothetical protein [Cetobacterium sp.]|uniref:hypothetical protein n=1 Tax=Cetobacterium sp. TaxID=2071632 RepID=UPI003F2ADE67